MKILVQNSLFYPRVVGGAEISTYLLATELAKRGHQVDALATTGVRTGMQALGHRNLEGTEGKVYEAPSHGLMDLYNPDGTMPTAGFLRRGMHHFAQIGSSAWEKWATQAIEQSQAEVLHTNTIVGMTSAVWRAAKRMNVPIVHTLRDYYLLCPRTTLLRSSGEDCTNAPLPCRVLRARKVPNSAMVDVVTGSSQYVLQRHLDAGAFKGVKTAIIPNACEELLEVAPVREAAGEVRGLYMGQLGEHKGVKAILYALAEAFADESLCDLSFDFAGNGVMREEIEHFAEEYPNRIRFHGVVKGDDKRRLLEQASFMVVPSIWNEPFGRTVLDGFSYGLPVIGAKRGGICEILRDGVDGIAIEPNVAELGAAMRRYVLEPELRLEHGVAGFERAKDFSLKAQIDKFEAVFRGLAESKV